MAQAVTILTAIKEILTLGWSVYLLWKEAEKKGWVKDGRTLSAVIRESKTNEERMDLARKLFERRSK